MVLYNTLLFYSISLLLYMFYISYIFTYCFVFRAVVLWGSLSILFYSIIFYSTLFYYTILCFIHFYSTMLIVFCCILFYSNLLYSILFCSILLYSVLLYSILFHSVLFYSMVFLYLAVTLGEHRNGADRVKLKTFPVMEASLCCCCCLRSAQLSPDRTAPPSG